MQLIIRYRDGSLQAAILLATYGGRLRVSIPTSDDAVEFRWAGARWLTENGRTVEIEFDAAPDEFYWCVRQAAAAGAPRPAPFARTPGMLLWTDRRPAAPTKAVRGRAQFPIRRRPAAD